MCHERWLRRQERGEYGRGERLWDLFYRETRSLPPPSQWRSATLTSP